MKYAPALAVVLGLLACRPAADRREARDFERMRIQQRYTTYGTSAFFANGAVLQAPPVHTVARDLSAIAGGDTRSDAFLTGRRSGAFVSDLPVPADERLRLAGADQFAISCSPCHGSLGFGDGPVAPNLYPGPPSLRTPVVAALAPGALFELITNGRGRMPPYGWQLTPEQRWAVIAYVRSWR